MKLVLGQPERENERDRDREERQRDERWRWTKKWPGESRKIDKGAEETEGEWCRDGGRGGGQTALRSTRKEEKDETYIFMHVL